MKFNEKLKELRLAKHLSQAELAKAGGVTARTLQYYEAGLKLPRKKETYTKLAAALGVKEEELTDDNASFITNAFSVYGERGASQAEQLVQSLAGLWAGGDMEVEDIDENMRALQEAYWDAKKRNRKYVPKKYRPTSET